MHDLATIQRMNSAIENVKLRKRAKALNNPEGNPKDAEKGRDLHKKYPGGPLTLRKARELAMKDLRDAEKRRGRRFVKHLKSSARTVGSWPSWKKEILGDLS